MSFTQDAIEKAIRVSQHCQRNWDLSREIPERDLAVLITAVSQCPSKQNVAYYDVQFITNRKLIEAVHERTDGFTITYEPLMTTTNPQVLANLLVIFVPRDLDSEALAIQERNVQTKEFADSDAEISSETAVILERDRNMAIGIAAGYVNLSATLLGYATGCCACFDGEGIASILGLSRAPALLMGVGFRDPERGRRLHQNDDTFLFPTKTKEKIDVVIRR